MACSARTTAATTVPSGSCVRSIKIETAYVETSAWTEHEIQFARRNQLGLLALQMPDRAEPLASIDFDFRIALGAKDFEKPPESISGQQPRAFNQWGRLKADKCREIALRAQSTHDRAVFRRRQSIRTNTEATLRTKGLDPQPIGPDGLMIVNGAVRYALWLTVRPPELADFRATYADVQATPPGTKGVVIGPTSAIEFVRKDRLDWLSGLCNFAFLDVDDVPVAAERMKSGLL